MTDAISTAARVSRALELLDDAPAVHAARSRQRESLIGRERAVTLSLAAGFVATAVLLAVAGAVPTEPGLLVLLLVLYAVASRVEFELGPGSAVPTVLVLAPMLFLLPPTVVPLCVAGGLVLGGTVDVATRRLSARRIPVLLVSSWHAVGPALVFWLVAPATPAWDALAVYTIALVAQFAFDAAATAARQSLGRGVPLRELVQPLGWTFVGDALLAPVALVVALAAVDQPLAVLAVASLLALLRLFAGARSDDIDRKVELGQAAELSAQEARTDDLTRLRNARAWREELAAAAEHLEAGGTVGVVLVDLDGLKVANDTHGHDVGDRLILATAVVLRAMARPTDLVARIGGDEFGIVVRDADAQMLDRLVGRLEAAFATDPGVSGLPLAASVGAATAPPARGIDHALAIADARLYDRKGKSALTRAARAV